ncbi:hypothetical protein GA0115257_103085 [Streptomyces sp. LcepLS]|nr:hypothetical protein GA0115257_103085 [Streptomyces sp. LcepLS]
MGMAVHTTESDPFPYTAIVETPGLPGHSRETATPAHDKAAMRDRLREQGVDATASRTRPGFSRAEELGEDEPGLRDAVRAEAEGAAQREGRRAALHAYGRGVVRLVRGPARAECDGDAAGGEREAARGVLDVARRPPARASAPRQEVAWDCPRKSAQTEPSTRV